MKNSKTVEEHEMQFNNLSAILGRYNCKMPNGMYEDCNNEYFRKINQSTPKDRDFLNPSRKNICFNEWTPESDIISQIGISINKLENNKDEILYHFNKLLKNYGGTDKSSKTKFYLQFKFKKNSGYVKKDHKEKIPNHCLFFNSDEFCVDNYLEIVEIDKLDVNNNNGNNDI